jgi:hypothetical protein
MQSDPYDVLTKALAPAGLIGQRENAGRLSRLIVSSQEGPVWPNRGNSFWLSQKDGVWYLVTWLPACYRVPASQDIVALCSACMLVGTSAMYRVPPEIVASFGLQELDDAEYGRLFSRETQCD